MKTKDIRKLEEILNAKEKKLVALVKKHNFIESYYKEIKLMEDEIITLRILIKVIKSSKFDKPLTIQEIKQARAIIYEHQPNFIGESMKDYLKASELILLKMMGEKLYV